jgi:DNA-binding transcriptional regulator YdaS (Cro superfamily)
MANVLVRKSTFSVDLPPRSRLYSLAPIGVGTPMFECLTSYINRLAWLYRISPRILIAEEIIPRLSRSYYFQSFSRTIIKFCYQEAMSVNSIGETSVDWSATIEGLTQQSGLQKLTLGEWASGIPFRHLLRVTPAWCPVCYAEQQEKKLPIYQPLLWMLQIVTFCTQHRRKLEEQCNKCQKRQSVFSNKAQPGHCTRCGVWLGVSVEIAEEPEIDEEELLWQDWVVKTIEELRTVRVTYDAISWERISINLAACLEVKGEAARFSRLMGVSEKLISQWQHLERAPSFQKVLEICYAAGISPLQLMSDSAGMRNAIQAISDHPRRQPAHHRRQDVNREEIREYLQAVLDGRRPCRAMRQIERELGVGFKTIEGIFPLECSLVSKLYRAQRAQAWKQHIARACDEVQRVARDLYSQGIDPTQWRVSVRLSNPNFMLKPECRATLYGVRRKLGLEV